jgi:hypothetical protein
MPVAPPKPCTFPGCSALVVGGTRCPTHAVPRRVARFSDRFRGTAASRGYGSRWQAFRPIWLARFPLCAGVLLITEAWAPALAEEFHRLREAAREEGRLLLFSASGRTPHTTAAELCTYPPLQDFLARHPIFTWQPWDVSQPGNIIDHIKPHRGDPTLMWSEWNFQTLTDYAHNRKTARE